MSASTFDEPVQLYDEQIARFAPFQGAGDGARRPRSSSLHHYHHYQHQHRASLSSRTGNRRPLSEIDPNASVNLVTTDSTSVPTPAHYSVWDDEAMPGILSKVLSRRTSLEAGQIHKDSGTGGKLKITEKGRERRLSAGNWRARSSTSSSTHNDHETPSKRSSAGAPMVSSAAAASPSNDSPIHHHPSKRASPMHLDKVTTLARVPSSGAEEQDQDHQDAGDSSPSDSSITQQRARAYAALTGRTPSSGDGQANGAPLPSLDTIARASLSQPSLLPSQQASSSSANQYQPLTAVSPNAVSTSTTPNVQQQQCRRTTSSSASPSYTTNNENASPLKTSNAYRNKTPRRSRVQSANAVPLSASSPSPLRPALSPRQPVSTSTPTTSKTPIQHKNRRSLSQENSLVATRIARAFLVRELGENAIARRNSTSTPSKSWNVNENEQKELWLALHDGVLLCR